MKQAQFPVLYEINARIWLEEQGRSLGRCATLDEVPDSILDRLAALGVDWIWLMGVWQTGKAGRRVSLTESLWRSNYARLLPDVQEADICGSPYAVQAYTTHADFGGDSALRRFRERLHQRGLKLMTDFVPNHTAIDHGWAYEHPDFYIAGVEDDVSAVPASHVRVESKRGPMVLAHGRDPYFPGWPDTLQLNYRHPRVRQAMSDELMAVASRCDGVRCDMAMLILPDVFQRTWGSASLPADGSAPVDEPFWQESIGRVHSTFPGFLFLAEAYWDLEWTLQQHGFDFTYDKRLYDCLRDRNVEAVRAHLGADLAFQAKSARFLENHDEERAASTFPPAVHQAAAIVTFLVPGARLLHEGQLEGRKVRASVHLARRVEEPVDGLLQSFYERLLNCLRRADVHSGSWQLLSTRAAWEGNPTESQFLAFGWSRAGEPALLVAVNYGPTEGQCYVTTLPRLGLAAPTVVFQDLMSSARYERSRDDLASRGLYLDLPAWGFHVFECLEQG